MERQQRRYSQALLNGMTLSTQDIGKFSKRIGLGGMATAKRPRTSWHVDVMTGPSPVSLCSLSQLAAL